ncbi:MAG: tRNA (adenosine(37)-N6)-dimethylallyltransferase MiaA [Candidatus Veblenbacteria bacterium]|nr:tRNA (adenosine(37)-N6)-dimethylallyltransferase MiaA [Candidatus Veblenbacteria bacterium]
MNYSSVNPPLIAIIGPTTSGKSALALKLAKKLDGAVISADSQQMYRHAKIGTNQPNGHWHIATGKRKEVLRVKKLYVVQGVPHFFINTLSPNKQYSAVRFQAEVNKLCSKLFAIGQLPILVGGTMLYVSAVVEGYRFPPGKPNLKLRASLDRLSTAALQKKLKQADPATWRVIDRANRRRLIRALEHVMSTGSSFTQAQQHQPRPNTLILGLAPSKATLRRNITRRTKKMFNQGLAQEVRYLKKKFPHSPLLQSIGYREVSAFLSGSISRIEAEQQIISHTWQYAKRQVTWFKRLPSVHWINSSPPAIALTRTWLKQAKHQAGS